MLCPWCHRRNTFSSVLSLWHSSDSIWLVFQEISFRNTFNMGRALSRHHDLQPVCLIKIPLLAIQNPSVALLWDSQDFLTLTERSRSALMYNEDWVCFYRRTWTKLLRVKHPVQRKKGWYITLNLIYYELTRRFMSETDITMMKVKQIKRARPGIGISFSTK